MLTSILKFHISIDGHFGNNLSSDGLKVLALIVTNEMGPMIVIGFQMDNDG